MVQLQSCYCFIYALHALNWSGHNSYVWWNQIKAWNKVDACMLSFFGDTICFLTNRKMIKIVTLIDWLIFILYWHTTVDSLVFNNRVSHALDMTINFYYPPLSCFVFHLPNLLLTQNFVYPTLFSSVSPPFSWSTEECQLHVSQSQRFITI
jgi:hypothetical protein